MATVFFSYSHADEALRDQLEKHLTMLKRQGVIETWHDRMIPAGDNFERRSSCAWTPGCVELAKSAIQAASFFSGDR